MIRNLKTYKHYHRVEQNNLKVVSDDEVKVDLPNVNSFMNIANSPSEEPPDDWVLRYLGDLQNLVTGANAILANENVTAMMQNMMDNAWKRSVLS